MEEHALLAGKRLPGAMAVAVVNNLPDFLFNYLICFATLCALLAAPLPTALPLAGWAGPKAAGHWQAAAMLPVFLDAVQASGAPRVVGHARF